MEETKLRMDLRKEGLLPETEWDLDECISSVTVGIIKSADVRVSSAQKGLVCLHLLVYA